MKTIIKRHAIWNRLLAAPGRLRASLLRQGDVWPERPGDVRRAWCRGG